MAWGNMTKSWHPLKFTGLLSLLLTTVLLLAACAPKTPPPPPVPKTPSQVITEEGIKYFVWGLKLPGTSQDLKLKQGESLTWVPLSIISGVLFTGPEYNQYRPGQIFLSSGERLTGELFVDQLIEGTTDVGYWNLPFRQVRRLDMGQE